MFQAEDGIRDLVRSRGLGDVYKRQRQGDGGGEEAPHHEPDVGRGDRRAQLPRLAALNSCLLYTSDAADERSSVDLGGRRIIKKKKKQTTVQPRIYKTNKTRTTDKKMNRTNNTKQKSNDED